MNRLNLLVIISFGLFAYWCVPVFAESVADLHPPGEQRPLLDELALPSADGVDEAAFNEQMKDAETYTRNHQLITLLMFLIPLFVGLGFIFFKINKRLYRFLKQNHPPTVWFSSFLLSGITFFALIPFEAFRVFLEYKNGLLYGGYWPVFGTRVAIYFLIAVALAIFIGILFNLIQRSTRLWWISSALIILVVVLALGGLYPHRLPLTGVSAAAIIEGAAVERATVVSEIWDIGSLTLFEDNSGYKSGQIWAVASLFGNDILISRGALVELTPFEVEILLAKGEASRQLGHRAIILLAFTLILLLVLFIADMVTPYLCKRLKTSPPPDSRSLPILITVIVLGFLIAVPFLNSVNRYLESEAAEAAIIATRKPITAIDLYKKQVEFNLSGAQPNGILHLLIDPHPATTDNIAQARTLRQELAP